MRLLREYIELILQESASKEHGLGAIYSDFGDQIEIVLFKYDGIYAALSKRKGDEDLVKFLKDIIMNSAVGYMVLAKPERGEAYGAYEITHIAGSGYGSLLYKLGHALSPNGMLLMDRSKKQSGAPNISPDAMSSWKNQLVNRDAHKLDHLPPKNKTKSTKDDAEIVGIEGKEYLDYVYEPNPDDKVVADKLISKGEAALKELSDDVNRDANVLRHVFMSAGKNLFSNDYRAMLQRTTG